MLQPTLIGSKPTLHYAELCSVLACVANIVNDRPISIRTLTEEDIVPITVNQLLLGRSSTSSPTYPSDVTEDAPAVSVQQCHRYQSDTAPSLTAQCSVTETV